MAQKAGVLIKASNSIAVGTPVGVYTDSFQIYSNVTYTLSFKCINLNNTSILNYLRLCSSDRIQVLNDIHLENTTGYVASDKKEYFVKLTFKSDLKGRVKLLIGRTYVEGDVAGMPLFFIREVQLQKGKFVTEYEEHMDVVAKFRNLETKLNLLSSEIDMSVSKQELDSKLNPLIDEVSSIDIKSNRIDITSADRLNKQQSQISALTDKINLKVNSGDLSSLISQEADAIKIAFNNIAKDIVTISENGIELDGVIKCKGLADDTYAKFYPKLTNDGGVKFEMYLAGNTEASDFMIYNRYYKNGYLHVDPAASFGKGGATFFNNVTFATDDVQGQYAGVCYWQNGTYFPKENNKNLIGKQGYHFNGVYTGWVGSEPGLESSVQLVVSGRELQLRSNFKHSNIQADSSGYFRPTSTDSANTWALGSSTYRFSIVYCRTLNQSSDATLKEDIRYILRDDTSKQMMTARVYSNDVINYCDITLTDMYEFVRDDLPLVKFKFKASTIRDEIQPDLFGFIAQDIKDTKIGSILIESGNEGDTLSYDASSYTTVIAGALQEAIIREEKDEERITQLETKNKELTDRITVLENKNTELEAKNAELEARLKRLEELILNS